MNERELSVVHPHQSAHHFLNEAAKERLRSLRDALMAFSLANLSFIQVRFGLFYGEQLSYYKSFPLTKQILSALALDIILFGVIGWRFARWVRRAGTRFHYRIACAGIGVMLYPTIDFLRHHLLGYDAPKTLALMRNPLVIAVALIVLFAIWRWPRTALHVFAVIPMVFVPGVFITFGKIGYYSLKSRPDAPRQYPALFPTAASGAQPRVVWIIFDEVDQRLGFAERPKNCLLPHFDRLCRESLQATNAFPPGGDTLRSLPSLVTGHYVVKAEPSSRNELDLTYAGTDAPVAWSTQPSVFSRVHEMGVNTALVGWYHPYSRLFARYLNSCSWYAFVPYQRSRDATVLRSMIAQIWTMQPELQERHIQIDHYRKSLADAQRVVKDGRYGLVMLHLPGAHYPGIYDPVRGKFTLTCFSGTRGYFANLQLTDKALGVLRADMEQAGQWDHTWVIVTSDHWWRLASAYDGRMEHRIPFIVKAPGENQPITYGAAINTVITQDLILAILRKQVSTISDAVAWLDSHKAPPAPSYLDMPQISGDPDVDGG